MKTKAEKLLNPYRVQTTQKTVKDIDLDKRTVTGLFNSYFFIDSDLDMLLPGSASKSIQERGVDSKKGNKIKHLKDHDWSKNIARIDVLKEDEVEINGRMLKGIYHESFYPESQDSTDMLIKIQEGMYDSRSIGFQYEKLVLCMRDSENEDQAKNWDQYLPLAINPEKAEKSGYFWVVKEIRLWEGSDVAFGANALTPVLGIKSENKALAASQLYEKLDRATSLFKSGKLSDEGFHGLEMEIKQIKSYISALIEGKQPLKEAPQKPPAATQKSTGSNFMQELLKLQ